ncbi:cytochrome [Mycobacterium sp. E802]|uniref:cytochrome P450 n=1 Tax=Mycobacterium sp. E802 TaxID=1834152 RepID=UPI0008007477|nr:cytochrome P450 [Mycobacterium sp. E802]OBG88787.1 cytochrome [Mycobacterium sp. E802]
MTTALIFDPFSDEYFNNPYATYKRMRDEAPVYYSEKYDFYALTRHADVAAALKDHATFSSARGVTLEEVQQGNVAHEQSMIWMDPPEHRRMRSLVNKVFTPRAIGAMEPTIRELIDGYLSGIDKNSFDIVGDFSALFPVEVITAMLGVPVEQRQQIRIWQDIALRRERGQVGISDAGRQALMDTGMLYFELIQQRRAQPQDDMITALTTVEVDREDGSKTKLDDVEITGFAVLLGGAGAETVTKLIGNAAVMFSRHADQWQALRANRELIPAAVEELLRYDAPAQYAVRSATRDVELHGVTIPADSAVMLIEASANRDDRAFTEPDRFDITRDRSQAQNLGFGYGIHSCLGAALARMEGRIAIDRLLDFMPRYEVDHDSLRRVAMTSVAGYESVPVRVLETA